MKVDAEQDFHGFTRAGMISWLNGQLASRRWDGLQRVRIIHGKGEVLTPALRRWSDTHGIPWAPEPGNPGATILYPARRTSSGTASPEKSKARTDKPQPGLRRKRPPLRQSEPDSADVDLFQQEMKRLRERGPARG